MDKKGIEEVFNHFSRYDGMKEEIYGFVEFNPSILKSKDWNEDNYYNFSRELMSSIENIYEALVSELPEYTAESLVSAKNPPHKEISSLVGTNFSIELPGFKRTYFTDSIYKLYQQIYESKDNVNGLYLALINFNSGKPARTHHIEVVSLSRAFKNMMQLGTVNR